MSPQGVLRGWGWGWGSSVGGYVIRYRWQRRGPEVRPHRPRSAFGAAAAVQRKGGPSEELGGLLTVAAPSHLGEALAHVGWVPSSAVGSWKRGR